MNYLKTAFILVLMYNYIKCHSMGSNSDDNICEMRYLESIDGLVYAPSMTEGPFYATIKDFNETQDAISTGKKGFRDLTDDVISVTNGVPLTLTLNFFSVDSNNNSVPLKNAHVYIWYCHALGKYSSIKSEGTETEKWLRLVQPVDSTGKVVFKNIVPGWYTGRPLHYHLRVHLDSQSESSYIMTTQLFFPESIVNAIKEISPYKENKNTLILNNSDNIFNSIDSTLREKLVINAAGNVKDGYTASINIGIKSSSIQTLDVNEDKSGKSIYFAMENIMLIIFIIYGFAL